MNAAFIRAALKDHYPAPEYGIVYEVARATGFDAHRHIDAIAMDLWPSRGLALHAIEIKVGRSDWRREKANPEKAEELARFCDYFWIAAPADLIPADEVPDAWGLFAVDGDGRIAVAKRAARTEAQPFGRPFVAALLRAATRPIGDGTLDAMLAKRAAAQEKTFEERVKSRADSMAGRNQNDGRAWRRLVEAVGLDDGHYFDDEELIRAVRCVFQSGAVKTWSGLDDLQKRLEAASAQLAAAMRDLGLETTGKRGGKKRAS
jgi:hypothetical protein